MNTETQFKYKALPLGSIERLFYISHETTGEQRLSAERAIEKRLSSMSNFDKGELHAWVIAQNFKWVHGEADPVKTKAPQPDPSNSTYQMLVSKNIRVDFLDRKGRKRMLYKDGEALGYHCATEAHEKFCK